MVVFHKVAQKISSKVTLPRSKKEERTEVKINPKNSDSAKSVVFPFKLFGVFTSHTFWITSVSLCCPEIQSSSFLKEFQTLL